MDGLAFLSVIFILVGGVQVFVSIAVLKKYFRTKNTPYQILPAAISDMHIKYGKKGSVSHYPILSFYHLGKENKIKQSVNVSLRTNGIPDGKNFAVGDNVTVRIYENDVNTAVIDSEQVVNTFKFIGLVFSLIGGLFFVLGIIFLIIKLIG